MTTTPTEEAPRRVIRPRRRPPPDHAVPGPAVLHLPHGHRGRLRGRVRDLRAHRLRRQERARPPGRGPARRRDVRRQALAGGVRASRGARRRQGPRAAQREPELVKETLALFEESKDDDPRVRRYLALALGRLGDPGAVPALLGVVRDPAADPDPETLIYAVLALGGDRRSRRGARSCSRSRAAGRRPAQGGACTRWAPSTGREARAALAARPRRTPWRTCAGTRRWPWRARRDAGRGARARADAGPRAPGDACRTSRPEQANDVVLEAVAAAALLGDPSLRPRARAAARRGSRPQGARGGAARARGALSV